MKILYRKNSEHQSNRNAVSFRQLLPLEWSNKFSVISDFSFALYFQILSKTHEFSRYLWSLVNDNLSSPCITASFHQRWIIFMWQSILSQPSNIIFYFICCMGWLRFQSIFTFNWAFHVKTFHAWNSIPKLIYWNCRTFSWCFPFTLYS